VGLMVPQACNQETVAPNNALDVANWLPIKYVLTSVLSFAAADTGDRTISFCYYYSSDVYYFHS
jgi:hypothetical protein